MSKRDDDLAEVWTDWQKGVNMTPTELERWLETEESRSSGESHGGETTGHRSGRRILTLLGKKKHDLSPDDIEWMRKVIGYIARHRAQRPHGDITDTTWRYSLMNWGTTRRSEGNGCRAASVTSVGAVRRVRPSRK